MRYVKSLQNPLIKKLSLLQQKSSERRSEGLAVVEGRREVALAIQGGYHIEECVLCESFEKQNLDIVQASKTSATVISKKAYQKLAYRSTTEGILVVVRTKSHDLKTIKLNKKDLFLVVESPEKPGNIGAILRTAEASNLSAVIIANPKTDIYNQNVIRSSLGCLFTVNVAMGTTEEVISFLKKNLIKVYTTHISVSSKPYYNCDFKGSCAIVMGAENSGISPLWIKETSDQIIIPMMGKVDSMNLSVSSGILIFEALRQRTKL